MAKSLDIIDPQRELENKPQRDESEEEPFKTEEGHSNGAFYLVLGIIALVLAVGAALYIFYKDYNPAASSKSATATASAVGTGSTAITSTASATSTTTTTTSASAAASSSFKYTDETIRIVNGNGKDGEAARIKKLLEGKGYKIESTGNATRTYDSSIVYYKTGQENLAKALAETIKGEYSAEVENSDSTVGQYDAVIALGSK